MLGRSSYAHRRCPPTREVISIAGKHLHRLSLVPRLQDPERLFSHPSLRRCLTVKYWQADGWPRQDLQLLAVQYRDSRASVADTLLVLEEIQEIAV